MKLYKIFFSLLLMTSFTGFAQQNCDTLKTQEEKVKCTDQVIGKSIASNIKLPADMILEEESEMVYVRFTTDNKGEVKNARVLGKSEKELSDAVIEAIYKMSDDVDKSVMATNEVYRIPIVIETLD